MGIQMGTQIEIQRGMHHLFGVNLYEKYIHETHISMVHDGNKSFECNLCQFATATENNLKAHIKSVHAEKESYQCTICKKEFSGRNGKRNILCPFIM